MSERVAIIGGSTAGRDHFPFPVLENVEATDHPIGLDVNRACLWFYIVKRWSFEMTFLYRVINNDPSPDTVHEGAGHVFFEFEPYVMREEGAPLPVREADLVLPRFSTRLVFALRSDGTLTVPLESGEAVPFAIFNQSGSASYNDGSGEDFLFGELYFDMSFLHWPTSGGFEDGTINPLFVLNIDSSAGDNRMTTSAAGGTPSTQVRLDSTRSNLIELDLLGPDDLGGTQYAVHFEDIIYINPVSYWPYATKAGLPVYNTGTGAIINDPFS